MADGCHQILTENCMKPIHVVAVAVASVALGIGVGYAAKQSPTLLDLNASKTAKEAGLAALAEADRLAGVGTWEMIAVGRVYYLTGETQKGQALFDRATAGKPDPSNWERLGQVWAEIGDMAKADDCFQKALPLLDPKDDTGQAEIGAWFIRNGQRAKGEELMSRALQRHPAEIWHYLRAAEALLGVPPGR